MKKYLVSILVIISIFIFCSCGAFKDLKSLNPDELFRVYATSYREITVFNDETKQPERIWGINVKPLNDSIVKLNIINRENAELEIIHKNTVIKTKSIIAKNGNDYLQFFIVGINKENNKIKDSSSIVSIKTWADIYDVTLKIEINGKIRTFKYVSE